MEDSSVKVKPSEDGILWILGGVGIVHFSF